jgi:LmbE family N-acetylglucosaminyl deacetylase
VGLLAKKRQQEALRALEVLGVEPQTVTFLNQPDDELDQLSDENRQNVISQIVQLLSESGPEEVYVTYRRDAHADHEVTSQLVQAAIHQAGLSVHLMEYPIWSLYKPWKLDFKLPEFTTLYRLPIKTVRAKKRQAIVCHRSQYEPIPPDTYGGLPRGFIERLSSPYEFFFSSSSTDIQKSR